jgi:pilus assembly protein Flp/PilA
MLNTLKRLVIEEEGQGMAEYALILAFIAVACLAAYRTLGTKINAEVEKVDFKTEG